MNNKNAHTLDRNEFWTWAYSDFLSNAGRGVLAEFIVGKALGCTNGQRTEWDAYDLKLDTGQAIEVKSAAYLQSWPQTKPSTIRFDIAKKLSWYSAQNTIAKQTERPADIYVFCVFAEMDRHEANPLDVNQWFFLAASTSMINTTFPNQKSVGLSVLEGSGLTRLSYSELSTVIQGMLNAI